ncbi:MAG: bacterioferritin (cytochrome b1) [Clostridia bacterium]|nr:bacterioferritin (cytochrome b1) [Clostridia bacterium]
MAQNEKIIAGLQAIVTGLSQQADGHAIQSRIFANEGLTKLAEKYAEHAVEERGYVEKCTDRILDLGGEVKLEAKQSAPTYKNPVDWIRYDLQVSIDGLAWLKTLVEEAREDYTTFDILKEYYQDEEEDLYWAQGQLELIECIGLQNWLIRQL